MIDRDKKIAYVRIAAIAQATERDLVQTMRTLEKQGFKGLVLDLRFAHSESLGPAVRVADLFSDDGVIVYRSPDESSDDAGLGVLMVTRR